MGLFDWLTGRGGLGKYSQLVGWIESKYGKIDKNWDRFRLSGFMKDVLSKEERKKNEKKIAGLKKYIETEKYRGLIKNGD